MNAARVSGFTLLEVMVVMAMLTLLVGFTLIMNLDDFRAYLFRSERDTVVSLLQKARSQALSNVCLGHGCTDGQAHGLHFESGAYILFQGNSFSSTDVNNQIIAAGSSFEALPTSADVVFAQLSGRVASDWSLQLKDKFNHTTQVWVNTEGRIEY